jgi:hypothetical protein
VPTRVTDTGIGRALRKARTRRELTLEDASRGTRLRAEYLEALEREAFDELPGDVYIRSFLRSYGAFLGLDPEKVVGAYERVYGVARPAPAPVERAPALAAGEHPGLPDIRPHFPWPLAAAVAAIVLVAAVAAGVLSRSAFTPAPADSPGGASLPVLPEKVQIDLVANQDVEVVVWLDGVEKFDGTLMEGEARSWEAEEEIGLWLAAGQSVRLAVNGERIPTVKLGKPTEPYTGTFTRSEDGEERSGDG